MGEGKGGWGEGCTSCDVAGGDVDEMSKMR